MNNTFWLCWKGTKASVIKGWFNTLEEAVKYWKKQKRKNEMEIRNEDRTLVLYPKSKKEKVVENPNN